MYTLAQLKTGQLNQIQHLKISENLTEFPLEILELADTLEILDLSQNKLSSLPNRFSELQNLKILFLSDNYFTALPAVLGELPKLEMVGFKANKLSNIPGAALPKNLRWLILTDNQIPELPAEIGNCLKLQKLMLAGNKLPALPETLRNCENLELLRISANAFEHFPDWLFKMPRLSWLALAGNPVTEKPLETENLPEFPWQNLELQNLLGEGASGNIFRAILRNESVSGSERPVAVKVFKGHVTSDGFPQDEMRACMVMGEQPDLVNVLGKITGHPEQKPGLVLALIPEEYSNLGLPPSFLTCTRDTFPNGTVFSLKTVLATTTEIASAVAHLHDRGILHGDLYAHNILISENKPALLSDFGAATLYDRKNKTLSEKLEKPEVRAFGCLLDDLLQHLEPAESQMETAIALEEIRKACMQENIQNRPDFKEVHEQLQKLSVTF